ncbi:TonB-dependent siderophore receptor [Steroidobacter sp.]|uniref:TonB-dependent siderophore receptor n=1 Tax=Steroidobacter sp. TaxID=1978227 RepID=UPI001A3AA87C|nr:TonB-dependent receptor [Steroidobacter sp.]MBL8270002.1 TonB-dependent receptor [Steroidobacter sp.]
MRISAVVAAVLLSFASASNSAEAPAMARQSTAIPAQSLDTALRALANERGFHIVYLPEVVNALRTQGAAGVLTRDEALTQILSGTGLTFRYLDDDTVTITREAAGARAEPQLEEVIVTSRKFWPESSNAAAKFELPIVETPQALTVFTDDLMKVLKISGSDQLAAYTPGLQTAGYGDGTEVVLRSRGFPVSRERGYKINGITVDSEAGSVDYSALERVEVIRGPASVLYGEVDYGATINTVLKQPSRTPVANVSLELGSFHHMRSEADVGGALNDSGSISGRLALGAANSATFIRDTDNTSFTVAPAVRFDVSDATYLQLQAYYSSFEGGYTDGFTLLEDGSLPSPGVSNHYGASFNHSKKDIQFYFAELGHDFGNDWEAKVRAAYSKVVLEGKDSLMFGPATLEGDAFLFPYLESKSKPSWSVEGSLTKSLTLGGRQQTFMVSGDWQQQKIEQATFTTDEFYIKNLFDGEPLPVSDSIFQFVPGQSLVSEQQLYGVTALVHLRPTDKLSILAAGRWSGVKADIRDNRPIIGRDFTLSGSDDTLLKRVGVVYSFTPALNAYASFSEGVIFNATLLGGDGRPVAPERGEQYEIGLKGEIIGGKAMYAVSVFTIDRIDAVTTIDPNPDRPIYANIGSQTHEGVELELMGRITPSWNLLANYSYLNVDIEESANPAEVGHTPSEAPRHSASLFATHEVLSGALQGLSLGGGLVYRSEREIDSVGTYQLPSYTRLDARIAYAYNDHVLFEGNAVNLTNEKIYSSSYGEGVFGVRYLDGRAFYLRGTYRF